MPGGFLPGVELPKKPSLPTVIRWLLSKLFRNSAVESIQSCSSTTSSAKWHSHKCKRGQKMACQHSHQPIPSHAEACVWRPLHVHHDLGAHANHEQSKHSQACNQYLYALQDLASSLCHRHQNNRVPEGCFPSSPPHSVAHLPNSTLGLLGHP